MCVCVCIYIYTHIYRSIDIDMPHFSLPTLPVRLLTPLPLRAVSYGVPPPVLLYTSRSVYLCHLSLSTSISIYLHICVIR